MVNNHQGKFSTPDQMNIIRLDILIPSGVRVGQYLSTYGNEAALK
jgi:hypothetical protein